MRWWFLPILALVLSVLLSGCGPLYSAQKFGPSQVSGRNLAELVNNYGAPDTVGGNGDYLVLGWKQQEGVSVLGIFSQAKERTMGVVVDKEGNVVASGAYQSEGGLTILGMPWMWPVMTVHE